MSTRYCVWCSKGSVQEMLARSPVEELQEQRLEVDFKVALCALTIVRCAYNVDLVLYYHRALTLCRDMAMTQIGLVCQRYLTDHVNSVALGVAVRLISTNDTISALIPLVDRPPWKRRYPTFLSMQPHTEPLGIACGHRCTPLISVRSYVRGTE